MPNSLAKEMFTFCQNEETKSRVLEAKNTAQQLFTEMHRKIKNSNNCHNPCNTHETRNHK